MINEICIDDKDLPPPTLEALVEQAADEFYAQAGPIMPRTAQGLLCCAVRALQEDPLGLSTWPCSPGSKR